MASRMRVGNRQFAFVSRYQCATGHDVTANGIGVLHTAPGTGLRYGAEADGVGIRTLAAPQSRSAVLVVIPALHRNEGAAVSTNIYGWVETLLTGEVC